MNAKWTLLSVASIDAVRYLIGRQTPDGRDMKMLTPGESESTRCRHFSAVVLLNYGQNHADLLLPYNCTI